MMSGWRQLGGHARCVQPQLDGQPLLVHVIQSLLVLHWRRPKHKQLRTEIAEKNGQWTFFDAVVNLHKHFTLILTNLNILTWVFLFERIFEWKLNSLYWTPEDVQETDDLIEAQLTFYTEFDIRTSD